MSLFSFFLVVCKLASIIERRQQCWHM